MLFFVVQMTVFGVPGRGVCVKSLLGQHAAVKNFKNLNFWVKKFSWKNQSPIDWKCIPCWKRFMIILFLFYLGKMVLEEHVELANDRQGRGSQPEADIVSIEKVES
jgi:hypothetical protein